MAKQTIITYPAVAKDSGLGTPLADAFKMVNDNFTELYDDETQGEVNSITATAPISTDLAIGAVTLSLDDLGVTTGKIANDNVTIDKMANDSVGSDELVDNSVGAAALNVSGNGTAGYILKSDGDGSFSWIANDQGDLTAIVAGSGLTGTDLSGPIPTLNIGAGTGITVAADAISLTDGGVTATQLGANSVTTDKISDGNITVGKMAANSVDSDQYVDGSIDTIHIADDQVTYDKLGAEFTTSDSLTAATDVDMSFSAAQVFTMTSSIAVDINFTNAEIGQIKDLIVTDSGGTSSLTFDTTSNTITTIQGTYSATAGAVNFIQVVCTAANTFFLSISQSI